MIRDGGRSEFLFLLLPYSRRLAEQQPKLLYVLYTFQGVVSLGCWTNCPLWSQAIILEYFPITFELHHNPITERLSIDKYWMEWQSGEVGICNLGYRWIKFGLLLLFVFDYIFNSHNYFSCQSNGFLHIVGSLLKSWMWVNPELCSPSFEWQYNACWYFQPRFSSLIDVYWPFWLER